MPLAQATDKLHIAVDHAVLTSLYLTYSKFHAWSIYYRGHIWGYTEITNHRSESTGLELPYIFRIVLEHLRHSGRRDTDILIGFHLMKNEKYL